MRQRGSVSFFSAPSDQEFTDSHSLSHTSGVFFNPTRRTWFSGKQLSGRISTQGSTWGFDVTSCVSFLWGLAL